MIFEIVVVAISLSIELYLKMTIFDDKATTLS